MKVKITDKQGKVYKLKGKGEIIQHYQDHLALDSMISKGSKKELLSQALTYIFVEAPWFYREVTLSNK